jgi:hypothetical protein
LCDHLIVLRQGRQRFTRDHVNDLVAAGLKFANDPHPRGPDIADDGLAAGGSD